MTNHPGIHRNDHQSSPSSSSSSSFVEVRKSRTKSQHGIFSANNPKDDRTMTRRESRSKHIDDRESIVLVEKEPTSSPNKKNTGLAKTKNPKQGRLESSRKRNEAERNESDQDHVEEHHDSKIRRTVQSPDVMKIQSEDEGFYPRRSSRQRSAVPESVFYKSATTLAVPNSDERKTPSTEADTTSKPNAQKKLVPVNSKQTPKSHSHSASDRVQALIGNARRTLGSKKLSESDLKQSSVPSIKADNKDEDQDDSDDENQNHNDNDNEGEDGKPIKSSRNEKMTRLTTEMSASSNLRINSYGPPSIYADKAPPSKDFMGKVEQRVSEWLLEKHDNATQFIVSNEGLTDEHIWDPWFHSLLGRVLADNAFVYAIDLSRNHISSIPEELFKEAQLLRNIQSLNLSNNNLTELPDSLVHLNNLTSLDISHNKLSKLPRCVFKMKKLEYLNVGWNNLQILPHDIFRCFPRLQYLEVQRNKLEALPEEFEAALSLVYLDASYNNIVYELPDSLNLVANKL
eukprot:CAMPEP_0184696272 /NCGR_PEP_ID=MMETSP0313-20130426/3623_1 /TAXON_ID=2792 /ORGANISM="Porphyridium aerugineum, Strain SAG 1380-2" /LENGTH=513 /DNA_ID=CAMNT_0027154869 /DNA_START=244 /DNA_END=1781 /DNA_ORIENTATION=-